jgi:two-component system cell cycle response regulator CpdR
MDGSVDRRADGHNRTILLVEDDPEIRYATGALLGSLGYRILQAAQATEALRVLAGEPDVDLLLTDIRMPGGMTGIDLARAALAQRPALRVMFTSGSAVSDAAPELGPVLQKPYRFETLQAELEAALA